MKKLALSLIATMLAAMFAAPSLAGDAKPEARAMHPSARYVGSDNIVELIFGGPRYYDNRTITSAAGACFYHRTGPDANAINVVNDHYCGK